jgi:hypothetical protein
VLQALAFDLGVVPVLCQLAKRASRLLSGYCFALLLDHCPLLEQRIALLIEHHPLLSRLNAGIRKAPLHA